MRLQIGATGRWAGRGFWRRVLGSGPFRVTPLDIAVSEGDIEKVAGAVAILGPYLAQQPPSKHRLGSLVDLLDTVTFVNLKE